MAVFVEIKFVVDSPYVNPLFNGFGYGPGWMCVWPLWLWLESWMEDGINKFRLAYGHLIFSNGFNAN